MENSPKMLTRAMMLSSRLGCAETLDDPYYHRESHFPLPRIPGYHKRDKQARLADAHDRHVASNTWHARLMYLVPSISKTGSTNYYSRLQALHDPYQ